jgi:hypothetical protein
MRSIPKKNFPIAQLPRIWALDRRTADSASLHRGLRGCFCPRHASSSRHFLTMDSIAAFLFCGLLAGLATFQLGLVAGLPLGRFAWGGQHRILPTRLRFGSGIAIPIYGVLALIILDRAGLVAILPDAWSHSLAWATVLYLAFGLALNMISPSRDERRLMAPVAMLLLCCALVVAMESISPPSRFPATAT